MKEKPKSKVATHRVSLDIPKTAWIAARKQAILEETTPKEILERKHK